MSSTHLSIDELMPDAVEHLSESQRAHLEDCPSCWYDAQILAEVYTDESLADTLTIEPGSLPFMASDPQSNDLNQPASNHSSAVDFADVNLPGPSSMVDNIQIQQWVGNGLTGPVYKVFDPTEGLVFAAKVLENASALARTRIKAEFSTYRQVDHRVIIAPRSVEDSSDALVVYSQWVHGQSYDSWLGLGTRDLLRTPVSPRQTAPVLSVLLDLASALFYLHESGLVHGHIAPAKILVTENGRAQLLEAGLWTDVSRDGRLDPWRDYMAPESINGQVRVDTDDWFAFGELINLACRTIEAPPALKALGLALTRTNPQDRSRGAQALTALLEMVGPGLSSGDQHRYVDLGPLGQGGMGEVRRAHDPKLRRSVALKSVREDLVHDQDLISRFKAEAQIMAQLQHPGIVPVYEIARLADGRHYFSMQEIEGETLGGVLKRLGRPETTGQWTTVPSKNGGRDWHFQRLVEALQRVCDAMAYAHDRQVIHRDLKPENIMLGAYGEVFVIDWGLAKILGQNSEYETNSVDTARSENTSTETNYGWIGGTPAYMAPEQAWGRTGEIDHRSDIYSIGAILYHILTGEPPYTGDSSTDVIQQVRHVAPPALRSKKDDLKASAQSEFKLIWHQNAEILIDICERAMARVAEDRFDSTQTLGAELAAWHEGAKQRSAAMKAYEEAQEYQAKASTERQRLNELYWQCETEVQTTPLDDPSAWARYEDILSARQRAEDYHFEHAQILQVALAHSSTLVEAHKDLAIYHYEAGLAAARTVDERQLHRAKQLVTAHLSHLPYDGIWHGKLTNWLATIEVTPERSEKAPTRFVGRASLLSVCRDHCVKPGQLISLTGTSGSGKSRLVDEFLSQTEDLFAGGVYRCDLAFTAKPDELIQRVGEALGISLTQGDPMERIALALQARGRAAIVLDDIDQLDPLSLSLCRDWVTQAPDLTIFMTGTRTGIAIDCAEIEVPPLSLLSAMELFEAAAQNIHPSFKLNRTNWIEIKTIVSCVDALPLAVELAASRIGILSLQDLKERLQDGFAVVGNTDALSQALAWSWSLLDTVAQHTLMKTSIFRGGFDLDAAEAIMASEMGDSSQTVLDTLASLKQDNLLRTVTYKSRPTRYFLYASIKKFAMEKLHEEGVFQQTRQDVVDEIAAYYTPLGTADALEALDGREAWSRRRNLGLEFDSLRFCALHATSISHATNCAVAASAILDFQGPLVMGVRLLEAILLRPDITDFQRMRLAPLLSRFHEQDNTRAMRLELLENALTTAQEWNNKRFEGILLRAMGTLHHEEANTTEAEKYYNSALAAHLEPTHDRLRAITMTHLSRLYLQKGLLQDADAQLEEALAICQRVGDQRHTALCRLNMGRLASHQGDWIQARNHLEGALSIYRHIGYRRFQAQTLNTLANLSMDAGEFEIAENYYLEAISLHRRSGSEGTAAIVQGNLGELYLRQKAYGPAIEALTFAVDICDRTYPSAGAQFKGPLGLALAMVEKFEPAYRFCETGRRFLEKADQKPALGKHICFEGLVYARGHDKTTASRLWSQARQVFQEVQPGIKSQFGQLLAQLTEVLKQ